MAPFPVRAADGSYNPHGGTQRPFRVVLIRLRHAKEQRHHRPRDRHDAATECLRLADRPSEAHADDLSQILGIGMRAEADWGDFDDSNRDEPALFPSSGRRATARDPCGVILQRRRTICGRTQILELAGHLQPKTEEGVTASLVDSDRLGAAPLRQVCPHKRRGGFLTGGIRLEACLPCLQHLLGMGPPKTPPPVAGQLEARFLAQGLNTVPYRVRPVGLWLILERDSLCRQGSSERRISRQARLSQQRSTKHSLVRVEVDFEANARVRPDSASHRL